LIKLVAFSRGNNPHLVAAKSRALSVVIAESDETPTDSPERSATVSFFLEIYEMLVILPRCFSSTFQNAPSPADRGGGHAC
jgi:hypothetical protein